MSSPSKESAGGAAESPWEIPEVTPILRGKVRDVYDLGEQLLIVATDRVSAFDVILPQPIPDKGAILTQVSRFWFDQLSAAIPHHLLSTDARDLPEPFRSALSSGVSRFMVVEKLRMLPIECVVRGYLAGSGWKDYCATGSVCGIELPAGLVESSRLEAPIFTPSTKAATGHDENISWEQAAAVVGESRLQELRRRSLAVYEMGRRIAADRGIILADTKFEFGLRGGGGGDDWDDGELVLADEILTPDSSRYWPADEYQPGGSPPSFDKQFVRNYLEQCGWNKTPPAPDLPADVIAGTRERYVTLWQRLTGKTWH